MPPQVIAVELTTTFTKEVACRRESELEQGQVTSRGSQLPPRLWLNSLIIWSETFRQSFSSSWFYFKGIVFKYLDCYSDHRSETSNHQQVYNFMKLALSLSITDQTARSYIRDLENLLRSLLFWSTLSWNHNLIVRIWMNCLL